MPRKRALPNSNDIKFFLWLIYDGEQGSDLNGIADSCENYDRWRPTEYQLRTGMKRLVEVGLVTQDTDRFYAAQTETLAQFMSKNKKKNVDWMEEYELLEELVNGLPR